MQPCGRNSVCVWFLVCKQHPARLQAHRKLVESAWSLYQTNAFAIHLDLSDVLFDRRFVSIVDVPQDWVNYFDVPFGGAEDE